MVIKKKSYVSPEIMPMDVMDDDMMVLSCQEDYAESKGMVLDSGEEGRNEIWDDEY